MRRLPYLVLAVSLFVLPGRAAAWNKAGHMTHAAIAYAVLKKESPQTIAKVIARLKQHPQYESLWAKRNHDLDEKKAGLSAEEKDLYLFMQAARWADDIRSDSQYHQSEWHYINLPFKPPGQPDSVQPPAPISNNIIRAFEVNRTKVKNGHLSDGDRAVALAWVFHLVGDAHQPLHTTNLYTTEFPKGDKGGNAFMIRAKPNAQVINLHRFWDDLILGSDNFQTVRNESIKLREDPNLRKEKLTELKEKNFERWVKDEGWKLAKEVAYQNGQLVGHPERERAVTLPEGYIPRAQQVAHRQIVLAGYRLAAVLKEIVD